MSSLAEQIQHKIEAQLSPTHIEVIDESSKHNVPPGAESHFKLIVVSPSFSQQSLLERHQTIYQILAEEMKQQLHALAIHPLTPNEWMEKNRAVQATPACLGGNRETS